MAPQYAEADFDLQFFIHRRYGHARFGSNNFDPTPLLPDTAHPTARRHIEAIVGSIDTVSTRALLLRSIIEHDRHTGRLVSLHCETFSNTQGELRDLGDPIHKLAGKIKEAVDTLDLLLAERLLVDAVLTFRNVACPVSAAFRRQSYTLSMALKNIGADGNRCVALIRQLCLAWQHPGIDVPGISGRRQMVDSDENDTAAAELASLMIRIPRVAQEIPCWETCRNALLVLQNLYSNIIHNLPQVEHSFWGNLISPLLREVCHTMTREERLRYVHEGYYYGLLKLCPTLPEEHSEALYRHFPINPTLFARSRAEEFAQVIFAVQKRQQHGKSLVRPNSRVLDAAARVSKIKRPGTKKGRTPRFKAEGWDFYTGDCGFTSTRNSRCEVYIDHDTGVRHLGRQSDWSGALFWHTCLVSRCTSCSKIWFTSTKGSRKRDV